MRTSLAALVLSFAFAQPSLGGDQGSVVGTWKLVSYEVEAQASGERGPVMGQSPTGYASFLPEGRVFFMLTGEARKPGKTDRERADLLSTLVAYTGTYRLDGDKWTTSVEVAWNPEWVGTEQVRSFKLEGERLQVLTPWRVMPRQRRCKTRRATFRSCSCRWRGIPSPPVSSRASHVPAAT